MMYVETRRISGAAPQVLFDHLATAEAWAVWGHFPSSVLERPGTGTRYGVGAIRRIWPAREETVVHEPPEHYAYRLLAGGPIRDYRADVRLEPRADGGTDLRWTARFEPRLPGTGAAARLALRGLVGYLAAGLVRHCAACPPGCPAHNAT